jgi:hypothetical protein
LNRGALSRIQGRFCPSHTLEADDASIVIKSLLQRIEALAGRHGARVSFVLHPSSSDFGYPTRRDYDAALARGEVSRVEAAVVEGRASFVRILAELDFDTLDFLGVIRAKQRDLREFYLDIGHLTPRGNALLSNAIAGHLEGRLDGEACCPNAR